MMIEKPMNEYEKKIEELEREIHLLKMEKKELEHIIKEITKRYSKQNDELIKLLLQTKGGKHDNN